jgi:hypothetical protein
MDRFPTFIVAVVRKAFDCVLKLLANNTPDALVDGLSCLEAKGHFRLRWGR